MWGRPTWTRPTWTRPIWTGPIWTGPIWAMALLMPCVLHAGLAHPDSPWTRWLAPARTGLVAATALSHGALYLGITLLFGLSLLPRREALVSRLARRVEPCVTPALLAYTRGVTWLWTGFGVAQLAGSAVLLAAAPLPVWSGFVNLLDAPLVGLTFAAEYGVRRWRFRGTRLASLADTARAFGRRDGSVPRGRRR